MNADRVEAQLAESSGIATRPAYFRSGEARLFGWLHTPAPESPAALGLVICNPFGYEAICAHRSVRAFAHAAASMGVPALRFDYRGSGDSEDSAVPGEQLSEWSSDIKAAVDELRRRTGVRRVCLLGFRLGAMAASLAASECDVVDALIAVAPITSGQRYLRELRTIQRAAGQMVDPGDGARPMEVSGFSLAAATVGALAGIDLTACALRIPSRVLVLDRSESPGARAWSDSLRERGASVHYAALPGFVRMMMTAPHLTLVPRAMISAMESWLAGVRAEGESASQPRGDELDASAARSAVRVSQSSETVVEVAGFLPTKHPLFGIVTEPAAGAARSGIILLNAGSTHHVGPNRLYVTLARRWALQQCVVLRLDLSGLGESAAPPDQAENDPYPVTALEEIRSAVEFLRSRYDPGEVALAGLCSGAYHALRAAVAGVGVDRIIMVNPLNFYREDGITHNDLLRLGFLHNPGMYVRQNIPTRFWRKLLSGQVNLLRLADIYSGYAGVQLQRLARALARRVGLPLRRDLHHELEGLCARGVRVAFVFARGEPGIALLRHQAGSLGRRLEPSCAVHFVEGADHIFSQSGPRSVLESLLSRELFGPRVASTPNQMSVTQVNEEVAR